MQSNLNDRKNEKKNIKKIMKGREKNERKPNKIKTTLNDLDKRILFFFFNLFCLSRHTEIIDGITLRRGIE